ncbi:MAG: lipoate--protein ligase family protein [Candidatus Latescibacteria bacterium]|jgi:lipoyl(octanoyl) transferase|nr:lipoate--protein ligase family protein [Candidatus Latescibacterota bacterium]
MSAFIDALSHWRFLDSGPGTAVYNMAVDEAVTDEVRSGSVPPTIRVYSWSPPAVSLGYAQILHEEIDPEKCAMYGIDVIRRQTGGRTVLHGCELTYSVIAPEGHPAIGNSAYETYRRVSESLQTALEEVGVPVELAEAPDSTPEGSAGACFSYAARFELVVSGKKIAGSAQRRARGAVLQHGSILLGPDHKRLPLLLPNRRHAERAELAAMLNDRTIDVSEILGRSVAPEEMTPLVRHGFESGLEVSFIDQPLTAQEEIAVARLSTGKYGHHEWNSKTRPFHVAR